jgi:hypothetical protein
MATFNQFLDATYPNLTAEQRSRTISDHEIRERHALCHRSALRDWSHEQPAFVNIEKPDVYKPMTKPVITLPKVGIKELPF